MAATTARSPKSARPQGQSPRAPEESPFQRLYEVAARAQARLNHPKAEKSSALHEPVHLIPPLNELPGASGPQPQPEVRLIDASSLLQACSPPRPASQEQNGASPASSLPPARPGETAESGNRGAGSQPVQDNLASSASRPKSRAPRASTVAQAKNYLRATRSPKFLRSTPDLQRHRRKCAICRHPEREMIEEMFIHWHSPQTIAHFLDDYDEVNWVAIYRHAYALGLDAIRRRNLCYFFENLLDDAGEATPTFAGVLGAARALSCLTEDGRWVEPEKRILMTTVVRHEDPQALTSTDPDSIVSKPEERDREPFTSLPLARHGEKAGFGNGGTGSQPVQDNPTRSASGFESPATAHGPQDVDPSLLPQATFGNRGAGSQPARPRALGRQAARPSAREISLSPNSHKTKPKPISNR